ncbi:cysteine synthase A [Ornithobacterium rhinotracheale]|uniref:cysteine synthase A n=1 Tax=Ornithobacterium rhinotracheale TaxID=28251 RepID=UPI001FF11CD8|nr:cysteine synthase A [Ornithobacterium rhinotracheale]MCK0200400.1 cysteine synthase A [Ornithobacterium rhinotracheale]
MKFNNILGAIGNTPHVRLSNLFPNHEVWMKIERVNPGGSLKDRIALAMIEKAEKEGKINKDTLIVEPTSGNTGVGLAMVCAVKGYQLILVMPESMSIERRKLISAYGAKYCLTPREEGTPGAVKKAEELLAKLPNAWMPQQFKNEANPEIHRETSAQEILNDFDKIDYLITGVGTGGHITGVSEVLKQKFPEMKTYAVEPETSAVISGNPSGPHPLQGIGAGFVPDVLNVETLDGQILVSKEEAYDFTRRLASEEGILGGISTGASLAAISQKLDEIGEGKVVLTYNYDAGDRYFSIEDLFTLNEYKD